ncbi:MAG TPA: ABC transporter permease [Thermomicrobiales bacterium]|nr:ABC transporter permease [Thermomicrobiales bacterium]
MSRSGAAGATALERPPLTARFDLGRALLALFCAGVGVFLILPIFIVIPISFSSAQFLQFPPPGWSLQWYRNFFASPAWMNALKTSASVALPTTMLATVLGTAAALALIRSKFPGSGLLNAIIMAPLIVPVIIAACGIFAVFRIWGLVGTLGGLILAHTALAIPFVVVTVSASLRTVDRRLEQAARGLGASSWVAFRRITLPLILPGVLSGALFALVTSLDEVIVSLFISTAQVRPLAVQMWSDVRGAIDPTIAAISTMLFGFSLVLLLVFTLLRRASR